MTKKIDTLVDDIYGLFDDHEHVVDPKNITEFAEDVAYQVQAALADDGTRGFTVRASNVGKPCLRQTYYESKNTPREVLQPNVKLKFLYGHIIEALLLMLAREAGHDVRCTQKEVNLHGVKGHIDSIIDGEVVDVKSASTYSFQKFSDGTLPDNDAFGYLEQLGFYKQGLGGTVGENPSFLAMDKQHAHLALYTPSLFDLPSEGELSDKINDIRAVITDDKAPKRSPKFAPVDDGKSGNKKLCVNCSYCAYKVTCWPGLRGFAYASGPRYLTEVKVLPKVPEFNPAEELK